MKLAIDMFGRSVVVEVTNHVYLEAPVLGQVVIGFDGVVMRDSPAVVKAIREQYVQRTTAELKRCAEEAWPMAPNCREVRLYRQA